MFVKHLVHGDLECSHEATNADMLLLREVGDRDLIDCYIGRHFSA